AEGGPLELGGDGDPSRRPLLVVASAFPDFHVSRLALGSARAVGLLGAGDRGGKGRSESQGEQDGDNHRHPWVECGTGPYAMVTARVSGGIGVPAGGTLQDVSVFI